MIAGLNFNKTPIPDEAARLFAARLGKDYQRVGSNRTAEWTLQGVCNTAVEVERMILQASNGRRKFHYIRRGKYIALYIGWKD